MKSVEIFVAGVITIGLASALFMPGRSTASSVKALGDAGSKFLGTAITGR